MPRTGNKNALKHGLYARKTPPTAGPGKKAREIASVTATILRLEDALAMIEQHMAKADPEHFAAVANSMANASVALFTGHRTLALITGKYTPLEDALAELQALEFHAD